MTIAFCSFVLVPTSSHLAKSKGCITGQELWITRFLTSVVSGSKPAFCWLVWRKRYYLIPQGCFLLRQSWKMVQVKKTQGFASLAYPASMGRNAWGPRQIASPSTYCALLLFKYWDGHISMSTSCKIAFLPLLLLAPHCSVSEANWVRKGTGSVSRGTSPTRKYFRSFLGQLIGTDLVSSAGNPGERVCQQWV